MVRPRAPTTGATPAATSHDRSRRSSAPSRSARLRTPTPLRRIAQLSARFCAAFVPEPAPRHSAQSARRAGSATCSPAARIPCMPPSGSSCGRCSPPPWSRSTATRSCSEAREPSSRHERCLFDLTVSRKAPAGRGLIFFARVVCPARSAVAEARLRSKITIAGEAGVTVSRPP
jgi:hypothetical protein